MNRRIFFVIWIFLKISTTLSLKEFNVSHSDLVDCKEYKILPRIGYAYKKFFELSNDFNNGNNHSDFLFRLKFYVQTDHDAHILLSSSDLPGPKERVYEIVIGAGGNSFSIIRENLKRGRLDYKHEGGILSSLEIVPIEITQNLAGRLEINIPGLERQPHLAYNDSNPVLVKYVSFSTFGDASAKWYYDCKFDGYEQEIKEEELSPMKKLSLLLFQNYEATVAPSTDMRIPINFKVLSVQLPLRSNIITTHFQMSLSWEDKRLSWNESEFGILSMSSSHIWSPNINVVNGAKKSFKSFHPIGTTLIHSNGTVIINVMDVAIETWCSDETQVKNWPDDELACDIMFGTISDDLSVFHPGSQIKSKTNVNEFSDWELVEVTANNAIDMAIESVPTVLEQFPELVIHLNLKRNNAFYRHVFYSPTYAIEMLLLLTFFVDGIYRCSISLLAFVLSCVGLIFISNFAPCTYVPDIIISYQVLASSSTASYILHIILLWLIKYPSQSVPSDCILIIINNSILRFILGIRHIDSKDFMETQKQPWKELAKIINRIAFVCVVFLICYLELTVNI